MDFIVGNFEFKRSFKSECSKVRTDFRTEKIEEVKTKNFNCLLFGSDVLIGIEKIGFWDGQFSIDNTFYHHSLDKKPTLEDLELLAKGNAIPNGIFCSLVINTSEDSFTFSRDSLSHYPVFYYSVGDQYILSNNIRMISAVLGGLKKTPIAALENCLFGGYFSGSPYENVSKLDFGKCVKGAKRMTLFQPKNRFTAKTYDEALRNAQKSITKHIDAVFNSCPDFKFVTDVTGGVDSRAILSFLLGPNKGREFTGRSLGAYPNPDANVAGYLLQKYNIPISDFPIQHKPLEQKLRESADLGGAIQADICHDSINIKNLVHFSGAFGELVGYVTNDPTSYITSDPVVNTIMQRVKNTFQFFKGPKLSPPPFKKYVKAISSRRINSKIVELISDKGIDLIENSYTDQIKELFNDGVPVNNLFQECYTQIRSTNHSGVQAMIRNRTRITPVPLANSWLLSSRDQLDANLSKHRKVLFDLIQMNCEELLWEPMANKKWSEELIPSDYDNQFKNLEVINFSSKNLSHFSNKLFNAVSIETPTPVDSIIPKKNKEESAALIHSAKIGTYQGLGNVILDTLDENHEIWDFWNRKKVIEYTVREPSDFRKDGLDIEILGLFVTSALWIANLDLPGGIFADTEF